MNFFAQSAFKIILAKINRLKEDGVSSRKIIITTTSFPLDTSLALAKLLDAYATKNETIELTYKIAGEVWEQWNEDRLKQFHEKWLDKTGNFAGYRNAPPPDNPKKVGLVVLVGADRIIDAASLADFYRLGPDTIWGNYLEGSFKSWIALRLEKANVGFEEKTVNTFDELLFVLKEEGCADLFQLDRLLCDLPLERFGAQDGKDALEIFLKGLQEIHLPSLIGFLNPRKKDLPQYIDRARRFFGYDLFMEETTKKRFLKKIEKLLEEKKERIDENRYFKKEERGKYNNDEDFIKAVQQYITEGDANTRKLLLNSDFIAINDKILKFKPQKEKSQTQLVKKLSGGPIDVVLTALWEMMKDFCKEYSSVAARELISIKILGKEFRYDDVSLGEGEIDSSAEKQEVAEEYLKRLLGGVDLFFDGGVYNDSSYLDTSFMGSDVSVVSQLINNDLRYIGARTAEPSFGFQISLVSLQGEELTKDFAWRLPDTNSFRIAQELVTWANGALTKEQAKYVLPAFHIPYHEEIMRASNEDETRRVLLQAIHQRYDEITNLLTQEWIEHNDPLISYLKDLSIVYRKFLEKAESDGIYSVFHENEENNEKSAWKLLREYYEKNARAFLGEDKDCQSSQMAPVLMRAFLFIKQRKHDGLEWVTSSHESSGIATILHPAVIEMLIAQTSYLFSCFRYAAKKEWTSNTTKDPFKSDIWQDYLDLAEIQMPLAGLIVDENDIVSTEIRGKELIHRIGTSSGKETPLSTRLLLRYEAYDDEDISDSELFEVSRESRLLCDLLKKYCIIHPHAHDGISLAFFWNKDIQPIISAVDTFLHELSINDNWQQARDKIYSVKICLLTESEEESGINSWIEEWKERWDAAETEDKYKFYKNCRFSVSHRIISRGKKQTEEDNHSKEFIEIIKDSDLDIMFFYDFIGALDKGNKFEKVDSYDTTERTLQFPIMEKPFCIIDDPENRHKRARLISNPQFSISSLHLEIMARIKHETIPPNEQHVLVGYGYFKPWSGIVNEGHKNSEWVVCIDPSIDDKLIRYKGDKTIDCEREIIGFGSGVGLHGELNYTISTEQLGLSDICYRLERAIAEVYIHWNNEQIENVAKSVIREAQSLSGLSLVRATGVSDYVRDFMAYSLTRKILSGTEDLLCDELISLDAYQHWFTQSEAGLEDEKRPDLLWLTAKLVNGRIFVEMYLIECKMAKENSEHLDKAEKQIKNGLKLLVRSFRPSEEHGYDDLRPDQRYWWLQLHRLIASNTKISKQRQQFIMAALERLADGVFDISWQAAVLSFWTDSDNDSIENIRTGEFYDDEIGSLRFQFYSIGREAVYKLCIGDKLECFQWNDKPIVFGKDRNYQKQGCLGDFIDKVKGKELEIDERKREEPNVVFESPPKQKPLGETRVIERRIPERILLGKTVHGGREVYWEFGHHKLSNRHLLIFGTSGMGKTYAIQCMLCELGKQGQNSLVMDYTKGFTKKQLESETQSILAPKQHILVNQPLPINPFKKQKQIIDEDIDAIIEKPAIAAKRIANIFSEIYGTFGDQQYSVLFDAIYDLINDQGEKATLDGLREVLESYIDDDLHQKNTVYSIISKIKPFIMGNPFSNGENNFNWDNIFENEENRCHIFQFAGMDSTSSRLVIEFSLWDLYSFVGGTGSKDLPKVLVLDEAQNLDLTEGSPVSKYLTEGRKFGLSLILATQIIKNLSGDKQSRLFQAGHKLFFRPSSTECKPYAQLIANSTGGGNVDEWVKELLSLDKGQCYSLGESLNTATGMLETKAFKINITSLGERVFYN
jgi:DNA phosphorothioation-dependent restriction protein DptH